MEDLRPATAKHGEANELDQGKRMSDEEMRIFIVLMTR
jgi:hypothetical protein